MNRKSVLIAALLSSACRTTAPLTDAHAQQGDAPMEQKLDEAAADAVKKGPVLGVQVLIQREGKPLFAKSYGFTALDKSIAVTSQTQFAIGSISKQLTAGAILQLVDAGKVSLTDPVSKYIPQMASPITVIQLINQTAGLPDFAQPAYLGKSHDEITTAIAQMQLEFVPGSKWRYSNSNYFMLGRILEVASGQSYGDYMQQQVFVPLGMHASSDCARMETNQSFFAKGSSASDGTIGAATDISPDFYFAAGGICSTTGDLALWQEALYEGKFLTPSSLAFMTTPAKPGDGSPCTYGAGVVVDEIAGHRRWWHNGALPSGFESHTSFFPDDHLSIIILTNSVHADPSALTAQLDATLSRIVLNLGPEPAKKPASAAPILDLSLPDGAAARFSGTFSISGTVAEISVKEGKVHSLVGGTTDLLLLYQGNDTFIVSANHAGGYHFLIEKGHATAIDLSRNGIVVGRMARTTP